MSHTTIYRWIQEYRRMKQLLSLLATYDIQQINEQFYELIVQEDAPLILMLIDQTTTHSQNQEERKNDWADPRRLL